MRKIINYVPTSVGPSRLEEILACAPDMTDENKEKVCIITDIARLGKLLKHPEITPKNFYTLYETPIQVLEAIQHNFQVELNTNLYKQSVSSLL
jgi:hypothetical protein